MKKEYLWAFYEYALLPQFGINEVRGWHGSDKLGPNESADYFSTSDHEFILIFEDYDGLGRDRQYIKETLGLDENDFVFVQPEAYAEAPPSLHLVFETPFKYAHGITGSFTLLRLRKRLKKDDNALYLGIRNNWGWIQVWQPPENVR